MGTFRTGLLAAVRSTAAGTEGNCLLSKPRAAPPLTMPEGADGSVMLDGLEFQEKRMGRWKSGALVGAACLLPRPALSEIAAEKVATWAANRARTCYVDLSDGHLKCGGRPLRTLAEARKLLAPGSLVKPQELGNCKARTAVWLFKWRALPNQPPITVDAETGKVIDCGS
jgi:hypothetical protein